MTNSPAEAATRRRSRRRPSRRAGARSSSRMPGSPDTCREDQLVRLGERAGRLHPGPGRPRRQRRRQRRPPTASPPAASQLQTARLRPRTGTGQTSGRDDSPRRARFHPDRARSRHTSADHPHLQRAGEQCPPPSRPGRRPFTWCREPKTATPSVSRNLPPYPEPEAPASSSSPSSRPTRSAHCWKARA